MNSQINDDFLKAYRHMEGLIEGQYPCELRVG